MKKTLADDLQRGTRRALALWTYLSDFSNTTRWSQPENSDLLFHGRLGVGVILSALTLAYALPGIGSAIAIPLLSSYLAGSFAGIFAPFLYRKCRELFGAVDTRDYLGSIDFSDPQCPVPLNNNFLLMASQLLASYLTAMIFAVAFIPSLAISSVLLGVSVGATFAHATTLLAKTYAMPVILGLVYGVAALSFIDTFVRFPDSADLQRPSVKSIDLNEPETSIQETAETKKIVYSSKSGIQKAAAEHARGSGPSTDL